MAFAWLVPLLTGCIDFSGLRCPPPPSSKPWTIDDYLFGLFIISGLCVWYFFIGVISNKKKEKNL